MFFRAYADILLCFIQRSKLNERHIAYTWEWKISVRASTLMRFRLITHTFRFVQSGPPTLKRWSFSPKTHRFEYFHESGSKQKRVYISHKWRRSKTHQNENDDLKDRRRVCSTYVTTRNYRFWTLYCGESKTLQSSSVNRIDPCMERAWVWKRNTSNLSRLWTPHSLLFVLSTEKSNSVI